MTTTDVEIRTHPVVRFAAFVHVVLDDLRETPAWSMTPGEQRAALVDLARAEARIAALRLRVLAAADTADVAAASAATSTSAWLAQATRRTRGAAHADVLLSRSLEDAHIATRDALADGLLAEDQARAVVRAVDALPESVEPADRARAEKHLLHLAGQHDAAALKHLGRHLLDVLDPEAADEAEGHRLDAEERAAARSTHLHLSANGDGTYTGRFKIGTLHAAMLRKVLHTFSAPRQVGAQDRRRLTRPELMGEAFCRFLERVPADRLPSAGGLSATVVVMLEYGRLVSGLGVAHLDTGEPISAGTARRLACEAGVVPAVLRRVLGGRSVVLDLGRRTRFHTESQRLAWTVRDRGCTAEGCDRPPGWCHAHHDEVSWAGGGGTSVERGRLLCAFHHRKAHSPAYEMTRLPSGQVSFHRRT
jgi:hypothetical protein